MRNKQKLESKEQLNDSKYIIFNTTWKGLKLKIAYAEQWVTSVEVSHLAITSENKEIMPISKTGYKSHFTNKVTVDSFGGPVKMVHAWFDEKSKSKEWQTYQNQEQEKLKNKQQLSLF